MTRVGIVGASGYAARELFRILTAHPGAEVVTATSRQDESTRVDALHPSLTGRLDLTCVPFNAGQVADSVQIAFLALPHVASMEVASQLRRRGVRLIDLSADYRLKDATVYADWYGHAHADAAGLREAVYGLPELYRKAIPAANLVANPGCYSSTSILGLAPLIADDRIERTGIIIDAKSGVSGAGRTPKLTTLFPECNESFSAYNVGRHRHTPEIEQVLTEIAKPAGGSVEVIFTPHLVPMDRGIMATIYAVPLGPVVEHELIDLFREFYRQSPFVRVVNHLPATKDSAYSNFCDITVRVVRGRIVVLAGLDNLIKGAAGAAVQNFNLMFGHPESTGLL
jgi:N-acetyl-gamma-glutamyl-phosphate reductase